MKEDVRNLNNAKSEAIDCLLDSKSFLLITCADPHTKKAPQLIIAAQSEKIMTVSLAFLLAQIPEFRKSIVDALKMTEYENR